MKVTRWQLESKEVMLDLKLDIDLADELADSTLDGCLRFKANPSLAQRDPKTAMIISTTGASPGPGGVYSIKMVTSPGEARSHSLPL